ncbi:DNA-directed RNA polymerase III subunit [Melia azedarach]|uniref:DNA-directed RNA polymerase III subunit n=1 Tax=Melia azedarach TaxID=155640 RepID=A0ACC1Y2S1_MELAZ|nr:DNA-directed RNA polymerase III subunit [Melia azedarach]
MAFRGRGRGRGGYGGGGGGFGYAKQEPFELFPFSIVQMQDIELPDHRNVPVEKNLILWNSRLLNYWKSSPYFLEESVEKSERWSQNTDIERYSDWSKPKITSNRGSINQFMRLRSSNFPAELVKDSKEVRNPKRVRWNADAGLRKLDLFEKLEQKFQGQEEKDDKEKKEGEDEDEDDDEAAWRS